MATKKAPATSVQSILAAAQNVQKGDLKPPSSVRLEARHMVFWSAIMRARARDEWKDVDLIVAGQLARCMADIEREQEMLDKESTVVTNARGTQIGNPRAGVIETLCRRELSLMRSLQMTGRVIGDARGQVAQRAAEEEARKAALEVEEEDPLLA